MNFHISVFPTESRTAASRFSVAVRVKPAPNEVSLNASVSTSAALVQSAAFASAVLTADADQQTAYDRIAAPLVRCIVNGTPSAMLMCYGQTGSGKTHTVFGPPASLTEASLAARAPDAAAAAPGAWGMFGRALIDLLNAPAFEHSSLSVSAVEIYLDRVYDLLNGRSPVAFAASAARASSSRIENRLKNVQFDASGKWVPPLTMMQAAVSPTLADRTEHEIKSAEDIARTGRLIDATRSACGHALNERSSRSHCIITAKWIRKHATGDASTGASQRAPRTRISTSQLLLIDLAGSERVNKSGVAADGGGVQARVLHIPGSAPLQVPGSRFDEARNVNTSLSALGRVIAALAANGAHIPYRDSTLTNVLRSTFESRALCRVVLNVSSEAAHASETESTLRFGECLSTVERAHTHSRRLGGNSKAAASAAESSTASTSASASASSVVSATENDADSLEDVVDELRARLSRVLTELARLADAGHDGLVSQTVGVSHAAMLQFNEYKTELAGVRTEILTCKQNMSEARAVSRLASDQAHTAVAASSSSSAASSTVDTLQTELKRLRARENVLLGLVVRQASMGLATTPSAAWTAKHAEASALRTELTRMQALLA